MNYIYKPKPVLGKCVLGVQAGPQIIVVRQVIGEGETQKSLDIHICVPRQKPAIEQVIDVFIKKLCITDVRIIPNKVIVCGHFEVKAIYVACLPDQPVHAVEVRRVRFTADVPIWGACYGMEADAGVIVEYADFDCPHHRAKYHPAKHSFCKDDCDGPDIGEHHCHGHDGHHDHDDCDHHDHDDCDHHGHDDCDYHGHDDCDHHGQHWCKPECAPCHFHPAKGFREFDVAVVLRVTAKVMTDREVVVYPGQYPGLPIKPKG